MNGPVLLLCLLSFTLLGSLPLVFFRRGRVNASWVATAAPFFADAVLILAALAGVLKPIALPGGFDVALTYAAVPLIASALMLIGCTIGVNRVPLALWHQEDDAPSSLVTYGPYARMRHPFYTSFMLMLVGTAAALPHAGTIALLAVGVLQLARTARREERRLLTSSLGAEYAAYMSRTGRFVPSLHARAPRLPRDGGAVARRPASARRARAS